jgi:phenylacetate-CoA ligase
VNDSAVERSYRRFSRNWKVRLKDRHAHPWLERHWPICLEAERMSREELLELQRRRLASLLEHVIVHVPFYRDWARAQGFARGDALRLEDFPVTTKQDYRADPRAFLSDAYRAEDLMRMATSGSTGEPFVCTSDPSARDYVYACLWRALRRHGLRPGDPYAYFWGEAALYGLGPLQSRIARAKGRLRNYLSNRLHVSSADLGPESLREQLDRIERHRPVYLLGYTSALFVVARQMLDEGRRFRGFRLRAVVTEAEQLEDWQARTMREAFECPVIEHYGCVEIGHIAGTDPNGHLRVNDDLCLVETLSTGEAALTGLWTEAYPFIRYRVGDLVELRPDTPGPLPFSCLSRVQGRVADLVATPAGGYIGGIEFHAILSLYPEHVRRFQLHQLAPDRFVVKLELTKPLPDEARASLLSALRDRIGSPVAIELNDVDHIPPDPNGKFRWIISDVTRGLQRGAPS